MYGISIALMTPSTFHVCKSLSCDFAFSLTSRWNFSCFFFSPCPFSFPCLLSLVGGMTSVDKKMLTDDMQTEIFKKVLTYFHLCSYTFVTVMRTWSEWPMGRQKMHGLGTSVAPANGRPNFRHVHNPSRDQASSAIIANLETCELTKSDFFKSLCFESVGYAVRLWQEVTHNKYHFILGDNNGDY